MFPETSLRRDGLSQVAAIWSNRRALKSLAVQNLRRTYAGTLGGRLWPFLTPLFPFLILSVVFSFALKIPLGDAPYIYGFGAAYVPWVLLSLTIHSAAGSLIEHSYLVKRLAFPIEIIPANKILVQLLPHAFLLALVSIFCLSAGYGQPSILALVLYFYFCAVVLLVGAGLLVSSITVVIRDFHQVLPSIMQVWFWLTPIAWDSARLPSYGRKLLALNPASYVVSGYRYALMPKVFAAPTAFDTVAFWVTTLCLLAIGSICFRRLRSHFWECL
ncbi:MAG TPA: ABC transporter permease [Pyrinomonadaceae bacterium]|jgi:ABC-type polysaccharide/polyol phosphate export permease